MQVLLVLVLALAEDMALVQAAALVHTQGPEQAPRLVLGLQPPVFV